MHVDVPASLAERRSKTYSVMVAFDAISLLHGVDPSDPETIVVSPWHVIVFDAATFKHAGGSYKTRSVRLHFFVCEDESDSNDIELGAEIQFV